MDADIAQSVARLLVLTDAMGRRTHGLAMALLYLAEIKKGGMGVSGSYTVVRDNGVSAVWDGAYLPGLRCRSNKPVHAGQPVRMPGDQAARGIAEAHSRGIRYDESTWQGLCGWAQTLEVNIPVTLANNA